MMIRIRIFYPDLAKIRTLYRFGFGFATTAVNPLRHIRHTKVSFRSGPGTSDIETFASLIKAHCVPYHTHRSLYMTCPRPAPKTDFCVPNMPQRVYNVYQHR